MSHQQQKHKFKEVDLEEIASVLSLTIKQDDNNKLITFLCMLSAFTSDSQLNVSFNAPSSAGKSFMTTELAKLFPTEHKIELSSASPTSFYHGEGVWNDERKAKIVSLERKILIFYEQPDPRLQQRLRSVLSHDQWESNYRITNRDKNGSNRAELIILQGYPATVFCSAGLKMDEQEATRAILLSPELTDTKIKHGIELQATMHADGKGYREMIDANEPRQELIARIEAIALAKITDIIVPDPDSVVDKFYTQYPKSRARHMRDMGHLMKLIKAIALLNLWHRSPSDKMITASETDVLAAFQLWESVAHSQDLNIPPAALQFYETILLGAYKNKLGDQQFAEEMLQGEIGVSINEVAKFNYRSTGSALNMDYLRKNYLPMLEAAGLITISLPSLGHDRRTKHIFIEDLPGI